MDLRCSRPQSGLFCLAAKSLLVACIVFHPSRVLAQELDRDTVAAALRAAEESRASYDARFESYNIEQKPPPGKARVYERLTDGKGRVRRIDTAPIEDMYGDVATVVWSDAGTISLKKSSSDPNKPESYMINPKRTDSEHLDQFEQSLGLRFETSSRRPSDVVADRQEDVIVRYANGQDSGLVEVAFINPSFVTQSVITNVYDPSRQWGLVEHRFVFSKSKVTSEDIPADQLGYIGSFEMIDWKQSNGVWVPMHVHISGTFHPGTPQEETFQSVTDIQKFEINPSISDADFKMSPDHLPKDSAVVDQTLGISYKLGENRLYMDGHLNELKEPVAGLISAEQLPSLIQGAVPLIPPTPPLKSVASTVSWWRWGGYSLLAGGAVLLGAVFWIRRRGMVS